MGAFNKLGRLYEATDYVAVAAGQTTVAVGGLRSYIESITVIRASSTPQAVTLADGSTNILVTAVGAGGDTKPYSIPLGIRATSLSTGFKITTGASVAVVVVGKFSS
jgi:hypothetical protein